MHGNDLHIFTIKHNSESERNLLSADNSRFVQIHRRIDTVESARLAQERVREKLLALDDRGHVE